MVGGLMLLGFKRQFARFACTKVESVTLDFGKHGIAYSLRVKIDGRPLDLEESILFAWRDGFRGGVPVNAIRTAGLAPLDEMARMWIATGRLVDALDSPPWSGNLIHWKFERATDKS